MAFDSDVPQQLGIVDAKLANEPGLMATVRWLLKPVASLRLTVLLMALSNLIILIGTLAQDKEGMWEVMAHYFRSWIAWINVSVLFPSAWFPDLTDARMRVLVAAGAAVTGMLVGVPLIVQSRGRIGSLVAGGLFLLAGAVTAGLAFSMGRFLFPGGAAVGSLLAVNLLTAFFVRFGVKARGGQLTGGLIVLAVGAVFTWLVVASGHSADGMQDKPILDWQVLWLICLVMLTGVWAVMVGATVVMYLLKQGRLIETRILLGAAVLLTILVAWLWYSRDAAYLGDSGMRILWQLTKGLMVGVVMLVGCILLFQRRGGLVLLHMGLALLMLGEWFVSWYAVEERLSIQEGQTINYAIDIRDAELAIVDADASESHENVMVVASSLLRRKARTFAHVKELEEFGGELEHEVVREAHEKLLRESRREAVIRHEALPFDIQVVEYLKNSDIAQAKPGDPNPATAGNGMVYRAIEQRASSGADSSGRVDMASAYVRVVEKGGDEPLGTYLVSQYLSSQEIAEKVKVGDKTYDMSLRFKRSYKPYSVKLVDVRKDDYIGTNTPRNYSSDIVLMDPQRNVNREIRIWMNNPLRYAGETFYQSGYHRDPTSGIETTTLQLVTNTGWMIPYVSCMLVGVGMLAHFWFVLLRWLKRQAGVLASGLDATPVAEVADGSPAKPPKKPVSQPEGTMSLASVFWPNPTESLWGVATPLAIFLVLGLWLVGKSLPPRTSPDEFNLYAFSKLPVVDGGRIKPIDTLARTTLRKLSDKETIRLPDGEVLSAAEWMLMVVAKPVEAEKLPIFRIQNLEVLDTLGLDRRRGFRYSLAELRGTGDEPREQLATFDQHADEARRLDPIQTSFYQKKVVEVDNRFRSYTLLASAFQPLPFPKFPSEEEFQQDRDGVTQQLMQIRQLLQAADESKRMLDQMQAPLIAPMTTAEIDAADEAAANKAWLPYATAVNDAYVKGQVSKEPVSPATESLQAIFVAYANDSPRDFNREVEKYQRYLAANPPEEYNPRSVGVEAYYNHTSPLYYCIVLCVLAFLLSAFALLLWNSPLNRACFWVLVLTFVVYSLAMIARMYISGRPPITNLYSSAVFIGWACVLSGLILEAVYRLGVGNMIASVAGFSVLMIAAFLGLRNDTFTVMQAVLDTQFWLATHVVAITLGYAATFVAGLLGIAYILVGVFTPGLVQETDKALSRMIYAVVCFAIFFSFIGTVLGGLWADDSWGRFWGWDPKENGALIIVLWNAILLHSRWSGMVKNRGFAVLAVGGNIVTSWSWFGVNELGVGLHSYGFTEGVLLTLGIFVASQLAIIAIGTLPKNLWLSYRGQT